MQKIRLAKNTITSLLFQITTIICGFILPRQILKAYGSEVNGLVNSITQFLTVISFLELGVGAVVQSSLYKPLALRDNIKISKILASATRFFHRLGRIFLIYIAVLICAYPLIAKQNFGWIFTALLIAAMSISTFSQYYYGIVDRLLLSADQRAYVHYTAQTLTLLGNTVACIILIRLGASIHLVKLATSLIYLVRPLILRFYVNRHYQIDRHITYTGEPIQQKWNGIAQHVASVVLDGTDTIVLTVFASLSDVSIYSVYHLVADGVRQLLLSLTNGVHSLIGELWAKQELSKLWQTFAWFDWLTHSGTVFVFGCASSLILSFVKIYTQEVADANYNQPFFAVILILAHACRSLRLPYNSMILAAGHYKQTQSNYIIAALMNITISIFTVRYWGLVGVAIGTLAAMVYQTVWMAWYNAKNLLHWPFKNFCKQIAVDGFTILLAAPICQLLPHSACNYGEWTLCAIPVAFVWFISVFTLNLIFYRGMIFELFNRMRHVLRVNH